MSVVCLRVTFLPDVPAFYTESALTISLSVMCTLGTLAECVPTGCAYFAVMADGFSFWSTPLHWSQQVCQCPPPPPAFPRPHTQARHGGAGVGGLGHGLYWLSKFLRSCPCWTRLVPTRRTVRSQGLPD